MPDTDWIQIKLRTAADRADEAAGLLERLGALAVSYTDAGDSPILEPRPGERRLWPATEVTGLLPQGTDPAPLLRQLRAVLGDHLPLAAARLEDRDWIRVWMDQFRPLKFGRRLWICPSWLRVDEPDGVIVSLDPGLAFGTGTHPTTALCLRWLDSLDLKDRAVLDYGCGSGILGIAALKLGAASAVCVDIDDQALLAARANAARNGVESGAVFCADARKLARTFSCTVANILAGPLTELEPELARLTAGGGSLALSGILTEQAGEIIAAYTRDFTGLHLAESSEGWALITGTRA